MLKKFISLIALMAMITFSCSKETKNGVSNFKKATDEPADPPPIDVPYDCEYVLDETPINIYPLLANPDDPQEQILDEYMYFIAKALSRYTCVSPEFEGDVNSVAFDRYNDGFIEFEIEDMYTSHPQFAFLLDNELQSNIGMDWHSIKPLFTWHGYSYEVVVYLENAPVADWGLAPYICIGTDLDLPDEIADFIPAFYNPCEAEPFDPNELMIGKIDAQAVSASPEPIEFESECIYNPILIVELGWSKSKKAMHMGDPNDYSGTKIDTVIPGDPPAPPGCLFAQEYYLLSGGLAGQRFERSKRSEYNLEILTLPAQNSPKVGYPGDASRREHLKKIHKRDKNKTYWFNHELKSNIAGIGFFPLGPIGSVPDEFAYCATYEYDWYARNRNMDFDRPFPTSIYTPVLSMKRKGDHEHYQIITFPPADWCQAEVREFTIARGRAIVKAIN